MDDRSKLFLLKSVLLNDRLKMYSKYINEAKQQGYKVETLGEFYNHYKEDGKHFILRHDVDHKGEATRKMFEVEKNLGVRSTYFFRYSTVDKVLIDEMILAGFEIGFHFETIANYIDDNHITNKEDIDLEKCKVMLKKEVKEFEEMIEHPVFSLCAHGAPANKKIGISNNVITEERGILKDIGIDYEAYDKTMYEYVDCHIMDQSILYNYGFSYKDTPESSILEGRRNIIFLAHPNHWYLSRFQRIKKIMAFVLGKAKYSSSRTFSRIEK